MNMQSKYLQRQHHYSEQYIRKRRFHIDTRSIAWEFILFRALSRWGLNPIKPVYDPDGPDGRLNITASAFNQLGQYISSTGRRTRRFLP